MEKAVGSKVQLVRVNPATGAETTENAEVLSTVGGIVLRIGHASKCCAKTICRRA